MFVMILRAVSFAGDQWWWWWWHSLTCCDLYPALPSCWWNTGQQLWCSTSLVKADDIRSVGVDCACLRFLEETTVGVAITSQCFVATHTVLLASKHLQRTTWSSKTNTWVLLNNNTLLVGFDFHGRTRWTTSCYRNVFLLLVLIQNSPSTSHQGTPRDSSGHLFLGRLSVTDWAGICYSQHIAPELNITNTYASTNTSMYKQYYKCAT